jgi:NAD+ synthase (glutamine-hydrolysing)
MIRIALAQINPVVGDIKGNSALISAAMERAQKEGAQIVAVPELAVTGYPPEDLLLKRSFVAANEAALQDLAARTTDVLTIIGFVHKEDGHLFNAAAICQNGSVLGIYHKQLLPNYGVFDERRYFESGNEHLLLETKHGVVGVCVCEDAWSPTGPLVSQGDAGAQVIVNINASPFHKNKMREREAMLSDRARQSTASIAYVNAIGGQDELVFDGGSIVLDPSGKVIARMSQFVEDFAVLDVPLGETKGSGGGNVKRLPVELREPSGEVSMPLTEPLSREQEIYDAIKLGLHDYVTKNGFKKVVIGLSGGIDSALTAAFAADALGPDAVLGVGMPSDFSSSHSIDDAKALAVNLGIEMILMPVARIYNAYLEEMKAAFGEHPMGLAEENLQARIRGNFLMAISNRYGNLVLATGNKSEMACGYATLYGDMAGGFAVLKDVFKTEVYALCRYRNTISEAIPENVLIKPPSAELRPDQKDTDSLPPYEELDPILSAYIEEDLPFAEIAAKAPDAEAARRVIGLVDRAEYKRRQAPPGPKVTTKAFGRDRRLPITSRWHEAADLPERSVGPQK